jgi:hypothetical protein
MSDLRVEYGSILNLENEWLKQMVSCCLTHISQNLELTRVSLHHFAQRHVAKVAALPHLEGTGSRSVRQTEDKWSATRVNSNFRKAHVDSPRELCTCFSNICPAQTLRRHSLQTAYPRLYAWKVLKGLGWSVNIFPNCYFCFPRFSVCHWHCLSATRSTTSR